MKPRGLTWDGLGVGLSTSIWVVEWSIGGDPWNLADGIYLTEKDALWCARNKYESDVDVRVAEYRRVESC